MWFNKARALQEAERSLAQGRLSQAIQHYLEVIENDPSDLALINTVGDLCLRDNSIPEALTLFRKLAEAYTREGFLLRAVAIYKKILKVAPQECDAMIKLGDLYTQQGLSREARDLYSQALVISRKQNERDRGIEVLRRMAASDRSNVPQLLQLADSCVAAGRNGEALRAYLDASEAALAQNDAEGAKAALARASALDAAHERVAALRRRLDPGAEILAPPETDVEAAPPPPPPAAERVPAAAAPPIEPPRIEVEDAERAAQAVEVPAPLEEIDLSKEWDEWSATHEPPPIVAPAIDFDEASAEIEFYLDYGMTVEARNVLAQLTQQFPGDARVAELRRKIEERVNGAPPVSDASASNPPAAASSEDSLRDLARDLESAWSGPQPATAQPAPAPEPDLAASLSALLNEATEDAGPPPSGDDPQTHYSLGVAFREMGLLDEAIGEFQSVVRDVTPDSHPPHYVAACSLLALCFSEKRLPALAAAWYERALGAPGLDAEAFVALHYDLGVAQEQAGNLEAARESFLRVYSYNIDYRDVAEKVRQLASKS
jgi:tetratricopeptide (TPR) repeat protein